MFKIPIYDKSCLKVPTNRQSWDGRVHVKSDEIYLNSRVLRNSGLLFVNKLLKDELVAPLKTSDGVLFTYYCPVCHEPFLCTADESHTPYKICDRCDTYANNLMYVSCKEFTRAWVDIMQQNYDPLDVGTATATGKVCDEWKDPVIFIKNIIEKVDINRLRVKLRMLNQRVRIYVYKGTVWEPNSIKICMENENEKSFKRPHVDIRL